MKKEIKSSKVREHKDMLFLPFYSYRADINNNVQKAKKESKIDMLCIPFFPYFTR